MSFHCAKFAIKSALGALLCLGFIGGALFYTIKGRMDQEQSPSSISIPQRKNNASKIKFISKLKDGELQVSADSITILPNAAVIVNGLEAIYSPSNGKNNKIGNNGNKMGNKILISAASCEVDQEEKKITLREKISIETDGTIVHSDEALVDMKTETLISNGQVTGSKGDLSFTGTGFVVSKNGKIQLKNAKFTMNTKDKQ